MRRLVDLAIGCFLAQILAAGLAWGGAPVREPSQLPPGFVLDLQGVCDFPVQLVIVVNKEYTLTFPPDANGTTRQLVNGNLVVQFTNLDNGTSVTRNISGPGETLFYADGSNTLTARGAWAIFFFPEARGPGELGALFINDGLIVIHTEADQFHQSVLNQVGKQEDLCAVLD